MIIHSGVVFYVQLSISDLQIRIIMCHADHSSFLVWFCWVMYSSRVPQRGSYVQMGFVTSRSWTVCLYRRPCYITSKVDMFYKIVCLCLVIPCVLSMWQATFPTYHLLPVKSLYSTPFVNDHRDDFTSSVVLNSRVSDHTTSKYSKTRQSTASPIPKRLEVARSHLHFSPSDIDCTRRAYFWCHRQFWILPCPQSGEERVAATDLGAA